MMRTTRSTVLAKATLLLNALVLGRTDPYGVRFAGRHHGRADGGSADGCSDSATELLQPNRQNRRHPRKLPST